MTLFLPCHNCPTLEREGEIIYTTFISTQKKLIIAIFTKSIFDKWYCQTVYEIALSRCKENEFCLFHKRNYKI